MRYLLLIYQEPQIAEPAPEAMAAVMDAYWAYNAWLKERGHYLAADALQPVTDATTVQVVDGRTVTTDGPFAETKEHLGGYYLIEAKDLDEAIECAARLPAAVHGGKVEVRPIWEIPAQPPAEGAAAGASAG